MGADYKKASISPIIFTLDDVLAAGETVHWSIGIAKNAAANVVQIVIPHDMEVFDFYVVQRNAPGAGEQVQYWIYDLGIPGVTAINCTIENLELAASDLVNRVVLAAGDLICIRHIASVAAAATQITAAISSRRI